MTVDIAQLRALIANDEIPPLPWETDDEMGVLALDGRHCIGELSPQIVADFVVYVVNNLPALCDEVENARKLKSAMAALIGYYENNTLNFQREKLEGYISELRLALEKDG